MNRGNISRREVIRVTCGLMAIRCSIASSRAATRFRFR